MHPIQHYFHGALASVFTAALRNYLKSTKTRRWPSLCTLICYFWARNVLFVSLKASHCHHDGNNAVCHFFFQTSTFKIQIGFVAAVSEQVCV